MISSPHSAAISKKTFDDETFPNVADKTGCDITDVTDVTQKRKKKQNLTFCLETIIFIIFTCICCKQSFFTHNIFALVQKVQKHGNQVLQSLLK